MKLSAASSLAIYPEINAVFQRWGCCCRWAVDAQRRATGQGLGELRCVSPLGGSGGNAI
jgi:hypothetical protein